MEFSEVMNFYSELAKGPFKVGSYDLVTNNCIHFADAMSVKLCGHELSNYKDLIDLKVLRVMGIGVSAAALVGLGLYLLLPKKKKTKPDEEEHCHRKCNAEERK